MSKYSSITGMEVKYSNLCDCFIPWEDWRKSQSPLWWRTYNNVKHHRVEYDERENVPYYKLANQKNILTALAGLYVLEWYLLCEYRLTKEEVGDAVIFYNQTDEEIAAKCAKRQAAISLDKSEMRIINFRGLRSFFAGYYDFDYDKMVEIMLI